MTGFAAPGFPAGFGCDVTGSGRMELAMVAPINPIGGKTTSSILTRSRPVANAAGRGMTVWAITPDATEPSKTVSGGDVPIIPPIFVGRGSGHLAATPIDG